MRRLSPTVPTDEEHLSQLASRFRSTRQDDERRAIAVEYADTVERLIRSGHWNETPPPEDQLPDASMPRVFLEFWSNPVPVGSAVPESAHLSCEHQCYLDQDAVKNADTITLTDEERLSQLAGRFRNTRQDDERRNIAGEYAEIIERLIKRGHWDEMPPPEDQLPDDYMPQAFFDFWLGPRS